MNRVLLISYALLLLTGMLLLSSCEEEVKGPGEQAQGEELQLPEGFPMSAEDYTIPAKEYLGRTYISPDNPPTTAGVELGRYLFYDTRLSKNNNVSCASCHKQENAFTDTRRLSIGTNGERGKRQSMSLVNLAFNEHFFWDGRAENLEHQAIFPITDPLEMDMSAQGVVQRLAKDSLYPEMFKVAFGTDSIHIEQVQKALAQFQMSIVSYRSKFDSVQQKQATFSDLEEQGFELFFTHPDPNAGMRGADCFDCHGGRTFMSKAEEIPFMNNGLDANPEDLGFYTVTQDSGDIGRFKLVTLRNIALTPPYMHDGRFDNLQQVLDHYSDHVAKSSPNLDPHFDAAANEQAPYDDQLSLTEKEKEAVIAFLHTLTDHELTEDPKFSNPFKE